MSQRLLGLLLIVRALSPVLFLLVVGVALAIVIGDLDAALARPIQGIRSEIENVQQTFEDVRDDFEAVQQDVGEVVETLQSFQLPDLIPDIPANLSFPQINIPSLTIPVPTVSVRFSSVNIGITITYPSGLNIGTRNITIAVPAIPSFSIPLPGLGNLDDALRSSLSGITAVFDVFDEAFASLGALSATLQTVPDNFNAIISQSTALLTSLRALAVQWSGTLAVAFGVLLVLILVYFGVPMIDNFNRGWRMVRGLPAI